MEEIRKELWEYLEQVSQSHFDLCNWIKIMKRFMKEGTIDKRTTVGSIHKVTFEEAVQHMENALNKAMTNNRNLKDKLSR